MLSRVADNLYWMSRYLERAAHTSKLLDVSLNLMLDQGHASSPARWNRTLTALRIPKTAIEEMLGDTEPDQEPDARAITQKITFDPKHYSSIVSCIAEARENARQVREQISTEMWEQLNRLYLQVNLADMDAIWDAQPHAFFQSVEEGARLFQGITDGSMSHGEGWYFLQIGRAIERAGATAALLDVYFGEFRGKWQHPNEEAGFGQYVDWIGLLRSCQAFEAYCKVYTADVRPARIAEFLLLNDQFPHSVRFCVNSLQRALVSISTLTDNRTGGNLDRIVGRLRASMAFGQIDEIMSEGLHAYLENIQNRCGEIHTELQQIYIVYPIQSALN